jgi:histone H1/5
MSDKAKPKAVAKTKKPEASHPPSSVMVKAALENLKERKGSSLIAIKKYIGTNYKADPVKMSVFIKKALASGIEKKSILRVGEKGVGVTGRFKIAKPEEKPKTAKPKAKVAKKATPSKPKKKAAAKSKPAAVKKATPKKKAEKSKSAKPSAKPKKPVAKKAASKKPAAKAAPKKK